MIKCTTKNCLNNPCVQFYHLGKIISYCKKCWHNCCEIFSGVGIPIPKIHDVNYLMTRNTVKGEL